MSVIIVTMIIMPITTLRTSLSALLTLSRTNRPFAVPDPATLAPPNLERTFSVEELARHDGTDPALPILVAIKGLVYDVTRKRDSYGPGAGYHVFAGKDASCVCVE